MSFNTARIFTTPFGSKCLLEGKDQITLDGLNFPDHYSTSDASEDRPLYKFVWRDAFGFHLEPENNPPQMLGPMFGGVLAEIDYDAAQQLSQRAGYHVSEYIRVFDRFETQEQYDRLSR